MAGVGGSGWGKMETTVLNNNKKVNEKRVVWEVEKLKNLYV